MLKPLPRLRSYFVALLLLWLTFAAISATAATPLVVAHRGASAYLPEHTLAGKALAYAMGADYLEQDIVLSKDGAALVLHDIYLDAVSDVDQRFPDRARADGHYYAIDFTLAEIRQLQVRERSRRDSDQPMFPQRFPRGASRFHINTLDEEIELIQGLNRSTGRQVGLYTEIKDPAWHREQGYDSSAVVLEILARYGYRETNDAVFLQSFDAAELRRIRGELNSRLKLVQLLGEQRWGPAFASTDYTHLRSVTGLREVATYADAIGPWLNHISHLVDGQLVTTTLVTDAHTAGLRVHPYTLRADRLPDYAASFEVLLEHLLIDVGVDGVFTDFPDRVVQFIARRLRP